MWGCLGCSKFMVVMGRLGFRVWGCFSKEPEYWPSICGILACKGAVSGEPLVNSSRPDMRRKRQ